MPSQFFPDKKLSQSQANKLMRKLQMQYGAEAQLIEDQIKTETEMYGYATLETTAKRDLLWEKIRAEQLK